MGTDTVMAVYEAKRMWEGRLERGTRERIHLSGARIRLPKVITTLISLIF